MKKVLLAICLAVSISACTTGVSAGDTDPVTCDDIDAEILAADECAPGEGIKHKWADIRDAACSGGTNCFDLLLAIEYVDEQCPTGALEMLDRVCID